MSPPKLHLTDKQQQVLTYIQKVDGLVRPQQVQRALGISSNSLASDTPDKLTSPGLARRLPGKPAQFTPLRRHR